MLVLSATVLLAACSPRYDWRDYRSPDQGYTALFPGKPSTLERSVNLNGLTVHMSMTAAEVDGATFAVGSAVVPTPDQAPAALVAMQTALLRNIGASAAGGNSTPSAAIAGAKPGADAVIDIDAAGARMRLVGHLVARDKRIYQVIVVGPNKGVAHEELDMFISSFKLE